MDNLALEIVLVVVLILIGGTFTAAEVALISLRESQVKQLAATRGRRGRRLARLVGDPNLFLAAVQIGVTVATMLSSAFGAATIAHRVSGPLTRLGLSSGLADTIALIAVTLVLAFVSLVLGELTPKRLGLQRSEAVALVASGPLLWLARTFRPVVWLLGVCTNGAVRLLGGDPNAKGEVISEEELQGLVAGHESLSTVERRVISDVFAAEDTLVREVMVPRPEVEFVPAGMTLSRAARYIADLPHSRFPVVGRDIDDVVGVVHATDILVTAHPLGRSATVGDVAGPVTVLPGTKNVLDAMHEMRSAGQYLAVVVDEYGGTDGIVTIEDLVEEIVGEMAGFGESAAGDSQQRGFAAEVDGRLNLDDFAEQTGLTLEPGPYDTAAGFVMARLGRVPREGDAVLVVDTRVGSEHGSADDVAAPPGPGANDADEAATGRAGGDADADPPTDRPAVRLVVAAMDGRRIARIVVETAGPTGGEGPSTGIDPAGAGDPAGADDQAGGGDPAGGGDQANGGAPGDAGPGDAGPAPDIEPAGDGGTAPAHR